MFEDKINFYFYYFKDFNHLNPSHLLDIISYIVIISSFFVLFRNWNTKHLYHKKMILIEMVNIQKKELKKLQMAYNKLQLCQEKKKIYLKLKRFNAFKLEKEALLNKIRKLQEKHGLLP